MIFDLFWIDFFFKDKLFGFGIFTIKRNEIIRSFLSICSNDGELLIDLLWFRIYTNFPFLVLVVL
jgi:hypothetical protein